MKTGTTPPGMQRRTTRYSALNAAGGARPDHHAGHHGNTTGPSPRPDRTGHHPPLRQRPSQRPLGQRNPLLSSRTRRTDHVYAYQRSDGLRATSKEISLHTDNQDANGIWGDGTHLWVADPEDKLLYAYSLQGGSRAATQDITLHADNADARGLTGWKGEGDVRFLYVLDPRRTTTYTPTNSKETPAPTTSTSPLESATTPTLPGEYGKTPTPTAEGVRTAWVTNTGRIFAHDHEDEGSQGNSNYGTRLQLKDIRLDTDNLAHRGDMVRRRVHLGGGRRRPEAVRLSPGQHEENSL